MASRINILLAGALAAAVALSGCEVGPNYARPKVGQPASFKSDSAATQPSPRIQPAWWRLYHEDELDKLIAAADVSNQSVRQAIARVDQARALSGVAVSFLLPTVAANPSYARTHTSFNAPSQFTGQATHSSVTFDNWQVPFGATYEVDVWGRIRRSVESSVAQSVATADDLAVIQLTIQTEVATDYYMLRALDDQEQILQKTVTSYIEQVRLVTAQLKNGLVSPTDLYQAQALLDSTQAQQRDVQRTRADLEHALAILCGSPAPWFSVPSRPLVEGAIPSIPAGIPGELLTRRPDVAEAEQNVVSFNAQVGVATAEFYPTFNLTGTAGFESISFQNLFDWQSKVASIGPSISAPIFEGGRLKYNLEAVKAQYRQTVAAYVNQVLIAYGDVEDALTDLHAYTDEVSRMRVAVEASQNYLKASLVQYQQGLVNYLIVIDAERTLLTNQLTLSQDLNFQMAGSIHVIKALGGGWDANSPESEQERKSLNPKFSFP